MSGFSPSRRGVLGFMIAGAAAPRALAQTSNNLPAPLALEKLLGSYVFQVVQAAADQGIPEEVFVVSAGGDPKIARQIYQDGQQLVAAVARLLPVGTRGHEDYVAQLQQAADRLNAEAQPFLPRLKEAYRLQYAANDTNPAHAVIGFAGRLADQGMWAMYPAADFGSQGFFRRLEENFLINLRPRDPSRIHSPFAYPYLSNISANLMIGQMDELRALQSGTDSYSNIGQNLAGATVAVHQNQDALKHLLGIPVAALNANPGVTRRPMGAGLIGLPTPQ